MKNFAWTNLGIALLVSAGILWGLAALGVDITRLKPEQVRGFVLSFDGWAPAIFLLLSGQPVVPLPIMGISLVAGLAFGPLWGTLMAISGATIRASTQYGLARWLGRETVARWLRGRAAALDAAVGRYEFRAVLLVRLIPNVPFDLQNLGLGCSRVRFWPYVTATLLGVIPNCFAVAYFGYSMTDLRRSWKLLLALCFIAVIFFVIPKRWRARHPDATASFRSSTNPNHLAQRVRRNA